MEQIILFAFLILFPFGQIIRIGIIQPIDVVVGIGALWAILKRYKRPELFKYFNIFLFIAAFSWALNIFIFQRIEVYYGFLYLIRLAAYFYFFVFVWNFARKSQKNRKLLLNSLLAVSIVSAVFGWLQYLIVPDTRFLFLVGWDLHYLRLIGTFLDPPFIGLIIVFGIIISAIKYFENRNKLLLVTTAFLLVTLAFTYSRGSYLALLAGIVVLVFYTKKLRALITLILGLALLVFILPTSRNLNLNIFRINSVTDRLSDYAKTVSIIKTSPLFGVGYDNICLAKAKIDGGVNFSYHDCSGSNSSLLFVLATTGIIGLAAFLQLLIKSVQYTKRDMLYFSSLAALIVSGFFNNTMFYSWIMGYMAILLAVKLRSKV